MGTLIDWLGSGGGEHHDIAEGRGLVCAQCPLNRRGGVLQFFTRPAAALIQEQIERKNDLRLWTSVDALLGTCAACNCWMPLKVHAPADLITKHLKPKTRAKLHEDCWIRKL